MVKAVKKVLKKINKVNEGVMKFNDKLIKKFVK